MRVFYSIAEPKLFNFGSGTGSTFSLFGLWQCFVYVAMEQLFTANFKKMGNVWFYSIKTILQK